MTILALHMHTCGHTHAISCPYISKPFFLLRRRRGRFPIGPPLIVTQCVGLLSVCKHCVIWLQKKLPACCATVCECEHVFVCVCVWNGPQHFCALESFYQRERKTLMRNDGGPYVLTPSVHCRRRADVCGWRRRREEHITTCGSRTEDTFTPGLHNIPTPEASLKSPPSTSSVLSVFYSIPTSPSPLLPALQHLLSPPGIILFPHHNSAHICLLLSATQPCPPEPTTGKSFSRPMTLLCGSKTLLFELLIERWATTVSAIKSGLFWTLKGVKIVPPARFLLASAQGVCWLQNKSFAFKRCIFPTRGVDLLTFSITARSKDPPHPHYFRVCFTQKVKQSSKVCSQSCLAVKSPPESAVNGALKTLLNLLDAALFEVLVAFSSFPFIPRVRTVFLRRRWGLVFPYLQR